jgi:hypothetical protein
MSGNERNIMAKQTAVSQHLLLFRNSDWDKHVAPHELKQAMQKFVGWFDELKAQGKAVTGQPLVPEGKVISGSKGHTVADGPFAESKEAVGGYFLLQVASFDEALAIAKQCPTLEYGAIVEVRPVAPECPTLERANVQLASTRI